MPSVASRQSGVERCFQGMARSYAACDRWIGRLCEALLDDHTVICIVADHGGTPTSYPLVEVADVLEQTGFLVYTGDGNGGRVVDWTRTKAAPVGNVNIYVNLKGREPTGIVEPADYEQVRRDIIHALNGYREPGAGYCPFVFALRREDAEVANLWGELVGDVVYATLPEFTGGSRPAAAERPPRLGFAAYVLRHGRRRNQRGRPLATASAPSGCRADLGLRDGTAAAPRRRGRGGRGGADRSRLVPLSD